MTRIKSVVTATKDRLRNRLRARNLRVEIAEYKVKTGCHDCGYNKHPAALEFDHKDNDGVPYTGRTTTVATLMYHSKRRVLEEIAKCDVVCANCHAIRTHERRRAASRIGGMADAVGSDPTVR